MPMLCGPGASARIDSAALPAVSRVDNSVADQQAIGETCSSAIVCDSSSAILFAFVIYQLFKSPASRRLSPPASRLSQRTAAASVRSGNCSPSVSQRVLCCWTKPVPRYRCALVENGRGTGSHSSSESDSDDSVASDSDDSVDSGRCCAVARASSFAVGEGGGRAASIRTLQPRDSDTAQEYSPLRPVAITPSRLSFL